MNTTVNEKRFLIEPGIVDKTRIFHCKNILKISYKKTNHVTTVGRFSM